MLLSNMYTIACLWLEGVPVANA